MLTDDEIRTRFGNEVRKYRRNRGYSQVDFAEKVLRVDPTTLGRWELGKTSPSVEFLHLLAQQLDVSLDALVGTEVRSIKYNDKPIIWLVREARNNEEYIGLDIARYVFQGNSYQKTRQKFETLPDNYFKQCVKHVISSDMLLVDLEHVPLNEVLAKRLQKTFDFLKTCIVADLDQVSFGMLKTVILGALGAKVITDLSRKYKVSLKIGFAGGFSCARVIISLMQTNKLPEMSLIPIAVQSPKDAVVHDANSMIGMLGFYLNGNPNVSVQGLPYVSNAQLKETTDNELYKETRDMLEEARSVSAAFLGLGGDLNHFLNEIARPVHNRSVFCGKEPFHLKQMGCVGDILYNLVDRDGPIAEMQACCDQMVCSIGLEGLQGLSSGNAYVIAVASGKQKGPVAQVALQKRYINGLIVDSKLAQAILENQSL